MTATTSPATTGGSAMPEFRKLRTSVRPGGARNARSEAMLKPITSAIPVAAPDTVRERRTISYTSPFPVKMSRNASRMPSQMRSMTHLLYGIEAGSGVKSPGMNSGSPDAAPPKPSMPACPPPGGAPRPGRREEVGDEAPPFGPAPPGDDPLLVGRRVGDDHVQFAAA